MGDDIDGSVNIDFGYSVSLDASGITLAIGGIGDNGGATGIGATWIFTSSFTTNRTGAAIASGGTVTGTNTSFSSAMIGGTIVFANSTTSTITGYTSATSIVVSPSISVGTAQSFSIYYTNWTQQGPKLVSLSNGAALTNGNQGYSVSLCGNGNALAVGGPNTRGGISLLWTRDITTGLWTQHTPPNGTQNLLPSTATGGSKFGCAVSFSGNGRELMVGSYNVAEAYVFT